MARLGQEAQDAEDAERAAAGARRHALTLVQPSPPVLSEEAPRGVAQCQLDDNVYITLLRDRVTGSTLDERHDHVLVNSAPGTAIATRAGRRFARQLADLQNWQVAFPDAGDEAAGDGRGAAIFTRRGDYLATGWLSSYQHIE